VYGSFYDKISYGGSKSEFDLKHLLYKISLTSPVLYIILGVAGGKLTARILRIQKRVIRSMVQADSYLKN